MLAVSYYSVFNIVALSLKFIKDNLANGKKRPMHKQTETAMCHGAGEVSMIDLPHFIQPFSRVEK